MAIDCQSAVEEELKRLRDIQRLLQALTVALFGSLDSLNLEEVLS